MFHLRKGTSSEHLERQPGLWFPVLDGNKKSAIISCPGCGDVQSLTTKWTITASGLVSPSVDHSEVIGHIPPVPALPGYCQFHDNIVLEGWAT